MNRPLRWTITAGSSVTAFLGTWALTEWIFHADAGTAQAMAGLVSGVVTLPLAWWAEHGGQPGDKEETGLDPPPPGAWRIPVPRNPRFVGRVQLLADLEHNSQAGQTAVIQAVRGMGGIGKTQLVAEYAHRHRDRFRIVWWVDAAEPTTIGEQLAALAVALGLVGHEAPLAVATAYLAEHLRHHGGWLLVFDNARAVEDVARWLPDGNGTTVITSRARGWDEVGITIDVSTMDRSDSVALLRSRNPALTDHDAGQVADALQDLPLALAQAAGFMIASGVGATDYLDMLHRETAATLSEGSGGVYNGSLTAAVAISVAQLGGVDHGCVRLLHVCSMLAPDPIPASWLVTPAAAAEDPDSVWFGTMLAVRRLMARIIDIGLASATQDGIQLHRLTRAIVVGLIEPGERQAVRDAAHRVLGALAPGDTNDPEAWPRWAALMPHLLALDLAATDDPGVRRLASDAARHLLRRGHVAAGFELAQSLHHRWQIRFGADDLTVLAMAQRLTHAYHLLARFEDCRRLSADILDRYRRINGYDDPDTLWSANNLAGACAQLGELELARSLDQDTYERRRRTLGEDHADTLISANNLATVLRRLGEFDAARKLNEATLARRRALVGDDHPDTLISVSKLASDLRATGDFEQARQFDQDTLERRRRVLGPDHPDTLTSANNLADDLRHLREFERARQLDADTLERRQRILGPEHPATLRSAANLATDIERLERHGPASDQRTGQQLTNDMEPRHRRGGAGS